MRPIVRHPDRYQRQLIMNSSDATQTRFDPTDSVHEKLVASVVALERFQIDILGASGRDEMLDMAIKHLGEFLPIEVAGFYFPNALGEKITKRFIMPCLVFLQKIMFFRMIIRMEK